MVIHVAPKEIDFGYRSVDQYWTEVVVPSYEEFKSTPDRASAIKASIPAWHLLEWLWDEKQPSQSLDDFRANILKECPELAWLRDVAEGGKHRRLNRSNVIVKRVLPSWVRNLGALNTFAFNTMPFGGRAMAGPLSIELYDGTTHSFAEVLSHVMDYWQDNYFSTKN